MHSKTQRLVTILTNETQNGHLKWEEGLRNDIYSLRGKNNIITVGSEYVSVLGELEPCNRVYIKISDLWDKEIDQTGAIMTPNQSPQIIDDYNQLKTLYETARRSAKGIDEVIDDLLNEFDPSPF